ncbi:MAG: SlyX family protein [Pseudomonadota bacterium]
MTIAQEEHLAHLQKTVDELSDVVATQAGEIARLTKLVEVLAKREAARERDGAGGVVFEDERPPHY